MTPTEAAPALDLEPAHGQIRHPALKAAFLFLGVSLALAALVLVAKAGPGARDWSQPLWLRFGLFLARVAEAMAQAGATSAAQVGLPAAAAWGAWAACRRLLPGRFLEPAVGGLAFGFAPCLLTLLAHGVAREAFGHVLLPYLLLAGLRHGETRRPADGWLLAGLLAAGILFVRATAPAAVVVWLAAFVYGRRQAAGSGRPPLSLAWLAPGAAALLAYLADPFGGWGLDAFPSAAALRDSFTTAQRAASLVVLRSSLVAGGPAWTAPSAYLGKVVLLLAILALATPAPAWRPWKAAWAAALGLFLILYLLPGWWVGLTLPGASVVAEVGPWPLLGAAALMASVLGSLVLARALDALGARGRRRALLLAAVGGWLLVDAAQAVPRGWSELRGTAGRDELEPGPAALPTPAGSR